MHKRGPQVQSRLPAYPSHRWHILRSMTQGFFLYRHAKAGVRLGDGSGPVIGRIFRHPQAPEAQPWFWTITAREQPPSV